MRVFVTSVTDKTGCAVVPKLIGAGHQVVGLARSDDSAKTLAAVLAMTRSTTPSHRRQP